MATLGRPHRMSLDTTRTSMSLVLGLPCASSKVWFNSGAPLTPLDYCV